MPIDIKHQDLQSLRIDRSAKSGGPGGGETPVWARRYIIIGISIVVLLSLSALLYRLFASDIPEVEVARATAENSDIGGALASARGYNFAHHKNKFNYKLTGRRGWFWGEKSRQVKKG